MLWRLRPRGELKTKHAKRCDLLGVHTHTNIYKPISIRIKFVSCPRFGFWFQSLFIHITYGITPGCLLQNRRVFWPRQVGSPQDLQKAILMGMERRHVTWPSLHFFQDMPDTHPRKSGRQFGCSVGCCPGMVQLNMVKYSWHCLYLPKPFPKLIQVFEVAATKMNADSSRPQEKFPQPLHAMLVWSFWFHRCAFSKQISCNYHLECTRNGDLVWFG